MKVRYSERALSGLAAIHEYQRQEWPGVGERFDTRLVEIEQRIATFPTGATAIEDPPGVYAVPFINFPYRLFYTIERRRRDSARPQHLAAAVERPVNAGVTRLAREAQAVCMVRARRR